jgi:hypothetical protein
MVSTIVIMSLCLFGFSQLFPDEALTVVRELKYQLRMRILRRAALESAQKLEYLLHVRAAQQGIEPELVDQFLAEQRPNILGRLEEICTDQVFNSPDDPGGLN